MHRKNLAKRINTMLTILLLLLLIPLFLTIFCQKMQLEELLGNVNRTAEKEEDVDLGGKLELEYYKLKKTFEGAIQLENMDGQYETVTDK